jgi:putative restriction endonuclease
MNANGGNNPYYNFMTEVVPGDVVFSFANGRIIAVGVALGVARTSNKPTDFGNAGQVWSKEGWRVDVDFHRVERPLMPKNHMSILAPMLPERYSPIQANGNGNQGAYLTSISAELAKALLGLLGVDEITWPITDLSELSFNEEEQELIQNQSIEETMKSTLIMARRGQGAFRERVKFFEGSCRVTGVDQSELLIASHIKPWATSDNDERLNGHNGLFLSPHVDKLFDSGFISFENNGEILVSPSLDKNVLDRWSIDPLSRVKTFGDEQAYFLETHRRAVFRAA